jgi:hypothetical protein
MKIQAVVIQYPMKNHNSYIQFAFHDGVLLIKFWSGMIKKICRTFSSFKNNFTIIYDLERLYLAHNFHL